MMKSECSVGTSSLTKQGVLILLVFILLLSISPGGLETTNHNANNQLNQLTPATSPTILKFNTGGSLLESAAIDSETGYGYFGSGASPGEIFKIRLSDFTDVGSLTLGPGENGAAAAVISPFSHIGYIGTSSGQIVELNLTSFTETASISPGLGGIASATIDSAGTFAYFGTSTGWALKVRLSSLTVEKTIPIGSSVTVGSAIVDTTNGYAYFGASGCGPNVFYTPPNMIVKVRLSDFNITARLDPGEDCLSSATLDPAGGYAYFTGSDIGGHLLQIRLSDFSITGVLSPYPVPQAGSVVVDPARGVGYLGEAQSGLSAFRLSDLEQVESFYTTFGFYNQRAAALDPTTGNVYFTASTYDPQLGQTGAIIQLGPATLPTSDFTLKASPSTLSLQEGSIAAAYVNLESNNYTGTITFTAAASSNFAIKPTLTFLRPTAQLVLNGENSTILTISAPREDDVPPTTFIITVTGTSGEISRHVSLRVTVTPIDFQLFIQPDSLGLHPGEGYDPSIALQTWASFNGTVDLTASINPVDPNGPHVTVSPSSVQANYPPGYTGISNLFITTNSTTTPGQYEVDVTGTSGTNTSTASFCLLIVPSGIANFCVLSNPNRINIGPGQTRTSLVTVYKTLGLLNNTYPGTINLSASITTFPPNGANTVIATLNPSTINLPYQLPGPDRFRSILTVTASAAAPYGNYVVRVAAANGTVTGFVDIHVFVNASSVQGIPGLFTGVRVTYHISSLLAATTSIPVPPIPGLSEYLGGYSATLRSVATIGDETANLLTVSYLNGTQNSQSIQGNTLAESGSLFPWVIGSHIVFNNTTVNHIYAGTSRETSTLSITRTNGTVTSTGTWTWDIRTGLLLEYHLTLQGTGLFGSINAYVHVTISETNIWTPTQPYFTIRPVASSYLTIKNNIGTETSVSIRSKNSFNGAISLTAQTLPTALNVSLSIASAVDLAPSQNLTTPLSITPSRTGRYLILLNATSGDQIHYLQLHITIIPPPPLRLTITTLTPSSARAGDTITLSYTINNPDTVTSISINWGDGVTNTDLPGIATITHVYTKPGTYTITITATDNAGITSTTTTTMTVNQTPAPPPPTTTNTSTQPIPSVILYGIGAALITAILVGAVLALRSRQKPTQP